MSGAPPACGNGAVDPGEECDPPDGRTCTVTCRKVPICGDGFLDPGEQCDPPHASPPYPACDANCRLIASPSCVSDGNPCDATLPCCGGESCSNGYCGGQICRADGDLCNGSVACCGGLRCGSGGECACVAKGSACAGSEPCCQGSCTAQGSCGDCPALGSACDALTPCCFGTVCSAGVCVKAPEPACIAAGGACSDVAAGESHSCALFAGSAMCWGSNRFGQLGSGSSFDSTVAVQVQGLTSGVTAIAAGYGHTCAIVNGGVQCWGANDRGQLGSPLVGTMSLVPVPVEGLTAGVTAIAAASSHTCAVVDGVAKCWGANQDGQLGDGSFDR